MKRGLPFAVAAGLCAFVVLPAWATYLPAYTFVKMSLTVPWTLYFVFLACVLIPFVVMIVLAWRNAPKADRAAEDTAGSESARATP